MKRGTAEPFTPARQITCSVHFDVWVSLLQDSRSKGVSRCQLHSRRSRIRARLCGPFSRAAPHHRPATLVAWVGADNGAARGMHGTPIEHLVTDESIAQHRRSDNYLALRGARVLAASLTAPSRRRCGNCVIKVVSR